MGHSRRKILISISGSDLDYIRLALKEFTVREGENNPFIFVLDRLIKKEIKDSPKGNLELSRGAKAGVSRALEMASRCLLVSDRDRRAYRCLVKKFL